MEVKTSITKHLRNITISLLVLWALLTVLVYVMLTPSVAVSRAPDAQYHHSIISHQPPSLIATAPAPHQKGR